MSKTHTKPLKADRYLVTLYFNQTRLIDDAVAAVGHIRANGVGRQQGRSRGVIFRSFCDICILAGYSETEARSLWHNQVIALDLLNANAEE